MSRVSTWMLVLAVMGGMSLVGLGTSASAAIDQGERKEVKPVTVSGVSACAQCQGEIQGHDVMLITEGGTRFVLKGQGSAYKKAHRVRKSHKMMKAALSRPIKARMEKTRILA